MLKNKLISNRDTDKTTFHILMLRQPIYMRNEPKQDSSSSENTFDMQPQHIPASLGASKVQKAMLHSEHKVHTDALYEGHPNKSNTHEKEHPVHSNTYLNDY